MRAYVARIGTEDKFIDNPDGDVKVSQNDIIVVSGRRRLSSAARDG